MAELFAVDPTTWLAESELTEEYFEKFGDRLPEGLQAEQAKLVQRLQAAKANA